MSLTTILNGKRCYPKDKTIKNTFTNKSQSRLVKCDVCTCFLRVSVWKNTIVFYSFSEDMNKDFLCLRCALEPSKLFKKNLIVEQDLDKFVNKIRRKYDHDPSPLRKTRNCSDLEALGYRVIPCSSSYITYKCKRHDHRYCNGGGFQGRQKCQCSCHNKTKDSNLVNVGIKEENQMFQSLQIQKKNYYQMN